MVSEIRHEVPVINFGKVSVNVTSSFHLPLSLILLFLMFLYVCIAHFVIILHSWIFLTFESCVKMLLILVMAKFHLICIADC